MVRNIYLTLIAVVLVGCVEIHSDYLSKFHVYGYVTADNANITRMSERLHIKIIDIDLDDSRRPEQRTILKKEINFEQEFYFTQGYYWGSSAADALEKGRVSVVLQAEGCDPWVTQYKISSVLDEDREVVIKLGTVRLNC